MEIGTAVILSATSIGLGFVERALVGRPKLPSLAGQQNQQVSTRQAIAPWPVFYGRSRSGGTFTYMSVSGTNGEFLNLVITLAGHQINSIPNMYFDGVLVPVTSAGTGFNATGTYAGFVHVNYNLGTSGQGAFADLQAADPTWTSTCKQSGRAGAYVQLKYNPNLFPNGVPNIQFDIQGALLFDPRSSTTGYSENPALAIRDYLTNPSYGLGCAAGEINDASFIAAANSCDETVSLKSGGHLSGGGNQRYLCNGVFTTDQKPVDILNQLLSSMAGYLTWQNGKWNVYAGVWRAPTVTLTDDDLRGSVKIQMLASKSDLANQISGSIINPSQAWQPADFPPYMEDSNHGFGSDQWLAQDNGERIIQRIQLPFTIDSPMAQRIAKIQLERIRRQIRATWPCKISAYQLQPADVVNITRSRYGWTNKTFEVTQCVLSLEPDDQGVPLPAVDLSLRETDSNVYAWNPATEEQADPTAGTTTLPSSIVVPAPTGLSMSTQRTTRSDGSLDTYIHISWTAPTGTGAQFVSRIIIQTSPAGAGTWTTVGNVDAATTQFNIDGVSEGSAYDVQIYSYNVAGASSAVLQSLNFTVGTAVAYFTGGTINNSMGKSLLSNGGFELNTSLTPNNTALALQAPCSDDWFVSELGVSATYFDALLDNLSPRSGGNALRIKLTNGSVPSDNTNHESRVVTLSKIPLAVGDIIRITGWRRWDANASIPAGVTILQTLDCIVYAADNTELGYIGQSFTNSIQATYQLVNASLQIPSTLSGKVPSYVRIRCLLSITNNSGSALTTGANVYADCRWDDIKLVIQNTAYDLTPLNTASTPTSTTSPLSNNGVSTSISVASSTFQFGDGTITYNSGSVDPGSFGTWDVYADDPTFSGGAVTYQATNTPSNTVAANGRVFFGRITTASSTVVSGTGGGTGGGGPKGKGDITA